MFKRGGWALWAAIALAVVLIIGLFFYFSLSGPSYDRYYKTLADNGQLVNPTEGKSVEESAAQFNESFVYYLLYNIKAYNLHNVPLSDNKPRLQLYIGEIAYNAVIDSGKMIVAKGKISNEDVVIRTSTIEAVKMMQNKEYVFKSFESGGASIELVASKSTLFGKGYLNLYNQITGKSVSGNVVGIYTS